MQAELTIPANTPESSPTSKTMDVGVNSIRVIRVVTPDGHKYLARLRIESRGLQIFPTPGSDNWHKGNNNTSTAPINRRLEGPPYQLTLIGWNEDDTYPHSFYVEVE